MAILKNTDDGKISEQFDTSVWKELLLRRALVELVKGKRNVPIDQKLSVT